MNVWLWKADADRGEERDLYIRRKAEQPPSPDGRGPGHWIQVDIIERGSGPPARPSTVDWDEAKRFLDLLNEHRYSGDEDPGVPTNPRLHAYLLGKCGELATKHEFGLTRPGAVERLTRLGTYFRDLGLCLLNRTKE